MIENAIRMTKRTMSVAASRARFARGGRFRIARPRWSIGEIPIALHWSRRAEGDPGVRWLRRLANGLFREPARRRDIGD